MKFIHSAKVQTHLPKCLCKNTFFSISKTAKKISIFALEKSLKVPKMHFFCLKSQDFLTEITIFSTFQLNVTPTYEDPVPSSLIESSESDTKSTEESNDDDDEDDIVVVKEEKVKVESSSIKKICSKKNCTKIASIDIIGANKGEKVCVDCFVDAKSANVSSKGYIANASDESDANSIEPLVSHIINKSVIFLGKLHCLSH